MLCASAWRHNAARARCLAAVALSDAVGRSVAAFGAAAADVVAVAAAATEPLWLSGRHALRRRCVLLSFVSFSRLRDLFARSGVARKRIMLPSLTLFVRFCLDVFRVR